MEFALSFMYIAIGLTCLCCGVSFFIAIVIGRTIISNSTRWNIYHDVPVINESVVHDKRCRENSQQTS